MGETGFCEGLFDESEADGKKIKGKGPKVAYLEKAVRCVGIANGGKIDVNPKKIVAGKEVEKTNLFLQTLAGVAWDDEIDVEECVRRALNNEEPGEREAPRKNDSSAQDTKQEREEVLESKHSSSKPKTPSPREPSPRREEEEEEEPVREQNSRSNLASLLANANDDIETTRSIVNGIVAKPKCSDKLLGRPPFRFLHDVIIGVINTTGYHQGLYSGDELDGKKIKGKSSKIEFLAKLLNVVEEDASVNIDLNCNKVVAGKETDKTRIFLQQFCMIASNQQQSSSEKMTTKKKRKNISSPKRQDEKREEEEKRQERVDAAEMEAAERMAAERLAAQQRANEERRRERESKEREEEESKFSSHNNNGNDGTEQKMEFQPAVVERPKTKRLQRPTTARRRPPTIRQKVKVVEQKKEELHEDTRAQGVMLEGEESDEDEDDVSSKLDSDVSSKLSTADDEINVDGEHGRLVRDILESEKKKEKKKNNEGKSNDEESKNGDGGIRMSRIGSQSDSNRVKVDIKVLRKQVQILCRSANPLGGSIDFVHDDMEMMKKEYEKWKADFDSFTGKTEKEARKTESVLQPLISELKNIDEKIRAKKRQIHMKRAAIGRNDSRIADLLRMVTSIQKTSSPRGNKNTASLLSSSHPSSKRQDDNNVSEEEEVLRSEDVLSEDETLFGGK